MRLIDEKSLYLFSAYFTIFVVVGFLFYQTIISIINHDYQEKLKERKAYIIKQLQDSDSLLAYSKFSGQTLTIIPKEITPGKPDRISDTVIFDPIESKYMSFRQLEFSAFVDGKPYQVYVRRSLIETENILRGLIVVISIIFVILLLTLFFVNKWISKKVWMPFYTLLDRLKRYEIGKFGKIEFPETDVKEFKELIFVLNRMMDKISRDFEALKEYTENISHEVQTPLSVIKSKLELLLQSENINETEVQLLTSSYQAINKLSKITEALGLLIKIDNYHFSDAREIDFSELLQTKFAGYSELLEMKKIELRKVINGSFTIIIDPLLAEILADNLVINSIKHNIKKGKILLEASENQLTLSNTGKELQMEPGKLFQRFVKSNSQSLGLGLSIVKNICVITGLDISYTFEKPVHKITVIKKGRLPDNQGSLARLYNKMK